MSNPANLIFFIGRPTSNPAEHLKQTKEGKQFLDIRLACPRPAGDKVDTIPLRFWDKSAELLAEFVKKGDLISVNGTLRVDVWETDSGEIRNTIYGLGERFQMLESRRSREERQEAKPPAPTQKHPAASNAHAPKLVPGETMLDDDDLPPF